jgi:arylsulfatase
MGSPGPFRGELGEVTEGSIRTFCFIRWPGHIKADSTSYAMFSIMDFFPSFASIIGATMPSDRPIDGVDQTDVLFGKSESGKRDGLLSFIGGDLVAARSASAPMAGYPKIFNIEMDPHEDLNVFGLFPFAADPALRDVEDYLKSVRQYPNPPAPNITQFQSR